MKSQPRLSTAFMGFPANCIGNKILTTVSDAVIAFDLDLVVRSWNRAAENIYGWTEEEAIGKKITGILALKTFERIFGDVASGQVMYDVWDFEASHFRKDGTPLAILCSVNSLKDDDGDVRGFVSVNRDVTLSRRAEKLLKLQTKALNVAAHAIVITDCTGRIEWVNEAFTRLTEFSLAEVVGTDLWTLSRSEMLDERIFAEIKQTFKEGKAWEGEIINCRKSKTYYYEHLTIAPVESLEGAVGHFVCTREDITERIKAEAELKKQNDILKSIAWTQAHKVRSPVATILGLTQIFNERDPVDPLNKEILQHVQTMALQLDCVIREIVEQSHMGGAGENPAEQ